MADKMTPEERREWRYRFAGQAMVGWLANPLITQQYDTGYNAVAEDAVAYADALLAELEKEQTDDTN